MTGETAPTREWLGQWVRREWYAWARQQPDVLEHPGWLTPWSDLDERYREVYRRIGEALYRAGWEAREIAGRASRGELQYEPSEDELYRTGREATGREG